LPMVATQSQLINMHEDCLTSSLNYMRFIDLNWDNKYPMERGGTFN